jgi:hypothetical protein
MEIMKVASLEIEHDITRKCRKGQGKQVGRRPKCRKGQKAASKPTSEMSKKRKKDEKVAEKECRKPRIFSATSSKFVAAKNNKCNNRSCYICCFVSVAVG